MSLPVVSNELIDRGIFYRGPNDNAKVTMVLGKSRSGKTHFLVEQLNKLVGLKIPNKHGIERPMYDKIVIFTESLNAQPFSKLDSRLNYIIVKNYIPKIVMLLKKTNDNTDNNFRWLIVLDDCVGSASGKSLRGGLFVKQMLTFRNSNISTIVCIQDSTLIDPKSRANAHQIVITGLKIKDQCKVMEELLYDTYVHMIEEEASKNPNFKQPKGKLSICKYFYSKLGSNVLYYDNLDNKSYYIPRKDFNG